MLLLRHAIGFFIHTSKGKHNTIKDTHTYKYGYVWTAFLFPFITNNILCFGFETREMTNCYTNKRRVWSISLDGAVAQFQASILKFQCQKLLEFHLFKERGRFFVFYYIITTVIVWWKMDSFSWSCLRKFVWICMHIIKLNKFSKINNFRQMLILLYFALKYSNWCDESSVQFDELQLNFLSIKILTKCLEKDF